MNVYELIETSRTTESNVQPNVGGLDVLARFSRSTSSNVTHISTMDTNVFIAQLAHFTSEWQADVHTLNDIVNWQHKVIDFNASYTAYLLEQISDEDFEKIAEEMAVEETDLAPDEILPFIERALSLTSIHYTPTDFANMLHCSHESVLKALKTLAISNPKVQPLLRNFSE